MRGLNALKGLRGIIIYNIVVYAIPESKSNAEYLSAFIKEVEAGESTKQITKLNKLQKEVQFDADESAIIDFLRAVENPNARTNKAFPLIRLRQNALLSVAC